MKNNKINITLADDHEIMLDGLLNIINSIPDMVVMDAVKNGVELVESVDKQMPDVCLVDIDMPKMNGFEASEHLIKKHDDIKIIILSMHKEISLIKRMKAMGIKGYLIKTCDKDELTFAIRQVLKGKTYFSEEIFKEGFSEIKKEKSAIEKISTITKREYQIIQLLCDGKNNRQIADELFISYKTVDNHRTSIMQKLELHNIVELVRFCYRNNIIDE